MKDMPTAGEVFKTLHRARLGICCLLLTVINTHPADVRQVRRDSGRISGAMDRFAAIRKDGTLWTWCEFPGFGFMGGSKVFFKQPIQIDPAKNWISVSISLNSMVALKSDGTIWAWVGPTDYGTIAVEGDGLPLVPVSREGFWTAVSGEGGDFRAIRDDGTLWYWTTRRIPVLKEPPTELKSHPAYLVRQVGTEAGWVYVHSNGASSIMIKSDGTLWMAGYGKPEIFDAQTNWVFATKGRGCVLAVNRRGELWNWKVEKNNQQTDQSSVWRKTRIGTDSDWIAVYGGDHEHSLALKRDGTLWGWGSNTHGQFANGNLEDSDVPTPVLPGRKFRAAVGAFHTLAIRGDFSVVLAGVVKTRNFPKEGPPVLDFFTEKKVQSKRKTK
jgi:alpha-tubulin suppressor-like RCC1 family protein